MALPTAYLTSVKNLPDILATLQTAQAPKKFTRGFLEQLEFTSSTDRLVIGILKALGFLTDAGEPTDRYFAFLDQTQSARIIAEAVRDAYADLFQLNMNAHEMSRSDVKNKFRTLTKGEVSETVLDKMAMTFTALVGLGDFSAPPKKLPQGEDRPKEENNASDTHVKKTVSKVVPGSAAAALRFDNLVYTINLVLPETRDSAVYDALFKALREHLGQ